LAVIIKGKSVGGAKRLAVHLMRTDTNERAEVKELRGVAAEDLRGALLEMEAVASGTRTTKPFYHGSINTRADERLTDEQRVYAIDRLEAALGLTGQARTIVVHEKEGREHCHIVWSRIDLERMAAISDSHNYRKHEEVARALEREFGHERVQGAHAERDGKERPERTPSHAEMLQAERTGLSPNEAKEKITELWRSTDSGRAFAQALDQNGWVLARGDRRDFVVIDPKGGTHSLARRVEGAKAKDIRERMSDLDIERLPSVAEAKTIQRHRQTRDVERGQEGRGEIFQHAARKMLQADLGRTNATPIQSPGMSRAAEGMVSSVAKIADGLASLAEGLLGGAQEPPKPPTPHEIAAAEHRAAESEKEASRDALAKQSNDDLDKRRQELLREFGRSFENEQDAELERGRERDRTRR
jgi:hypothetical protein